MKGAFVISKYANHNKTILVVIENNPYNEYKVHFSGFICVV